jgi:hypothetical protein
MVDIRMIVEPTDITWKADWSYYVTDNLPYELSAIYDPVMKSLAVYTRTNELWKIFHVTSSEAECYIMWVIHTYQLVRWNLFEDWFFKE